MRTNPRRTLLPAPPLPSGPSLWQLLVATWPGRALVAGLAIKILTNATGTSITVLRWLDHLGAAALIIGGSYLTYRLFKLARRRLLWRVRRKLTISYMFIGVVPVMLLVTFFVLCGLLLFFNVSSYLVQSRLDDLRERAQAQAGITVLQIQGSSGEGREAVLARRYANVRAEFPSASITVIPTVGRPPCGVQDASQAASGATSSQKPIAVGPWSHVEAPRSLPRWISCRGFAGLFVYRPSGTANNYLVVRAVAMPEEAAPTYAVVIDLPVDETVSGRLRQDSGIQIGGLSIVTSDTATPVRPLIGRASVDRTNVPAVPPTSGVPRLPSYGDPNLPSTVAILDFTEWESGRTGRLTLGMGVNISDMYSRLASAQGRNSRFGQFLLLVVAVVGGLFLVIEAVALTMGLALARSITGSVHQLFQGTERVRQGDFSHKISVTARDQLGELADSFNSMTSSIEELLREMEKKKRLEEELRIAREIQMSLLPQGPLTMPGLSIAGLCVPAREVGGDYYDFLPLDEHRTGILIADVAGKGTSAALYMAELKGLVLALSQAHASPRQLMIHANRIISTSLDSRSFITMTYAVIDVSARTMTYARAGHTPLIHVPSAVDGQRHAQILIPDGMVLGLRIDRGEQFERMLEEVTIPLTSGDLFVLFTDGISEAMNAEADCFGEGRLRRLVEEHGHLSSEELRERILREIQTFVGAADQHDDMTMILLKVGEHGPPVGTGALAEADVSFASARSGA
jgi:sigma-B regulation protein RsbU (phosphoserine phosphatase)